MLNIKPRVTMCPRVFLFLIGSVFIYHQILATDIYIAELMVESNVSLEANTILSVLNNVTALEVTDKNDVSHTVTFSKTEVVAECIIIGDESTCQCSPGYIWANEVCYQYNCCSETACKQNVSDLTPLCIAKVKILVKGSVTMSAGSWSSTQTTALQTNFGQLNGFEYLNVIGQSPDNEVVDFEVSVSVKLNTSKLQAIVSLLETSLGAVLQVDTEGMVTIESPNTTVCYESNPELKCTFEEATGSAGWNISHHFRRFELNTGSVVKLSNCSTQEYKSCTAVRLQKVTGIWSGSYECGFITGSVRHTARTELSVALLPDAIEMRIKPLAVDCSGLPDSGASVDVTATIQNTSESFKVWWSYMGERRDDLSNTSEGDFLVYTFNAAVSCEKTSDAQYVNVTFENEKKQKKSARVDIPVIYEGETFCSEEYVNGEFWPKTPAGDTVINRTCTEDTVGYKSRTCEGTTWQDVFSRCVNIKLDRVVNAADNFLKGMGATQEVAMDIFTGLKNSTVDYSESMADIGASIDVLNIMASASKNVELQEEVFPDFVNAASNMLNSTWDGVNTSVVHNMSSNYLHSVEGLVSNIKVNTSKGFNSQNLELQFCSSGACKVSVFNINVDLNKTSGTMKAVAVKNLMHKLRNNRYGTEPTSLLISATLENNNDPSKEIRLHFPQEQLKNRKPLCVFWNTTEEQWSDEGCLVKAKLGDGNGTVCECNHLTAFSVLMAKGDVSNEVLDMITNVGLAVSICALLIFLIIESLVWSAVVKSNLSHFRHTAIVNIAVFLLLANCCFLASTSPESLSNNWCLVLTVCKHLFYLAMFSWMLCMSVMLVHQLIFVFSPLRKRVFMFLSSIVGYVCPILIVGSSYVYCEYTDRPYYKKDTCWLVFEKLLEGSIHAFLLPVGTVVLTNIFSMAVVIVTLTKSSVPDGSRADDKETAKSILKVVVFLTPVFGVTWVIGFALLILDEHNPMFAVANYSFTILNSFQGLFLLITGCLAEQKVREELLRLIMAKSGKSESTTNLISTTYTKDK